MLRERATVVVSKDRDEKRAKDSRTKATVNNGKKAVIRPQPSLHEMRDARPSQIKALKISYRVHTGALLAKDENAINERRGVIGDESVVILGYE